MNIVLCGIKHCGKSTLGSLLAKTRGVLFVDSDELIETNYQLLYGESRSVREIYRQCGKAAFHELEKDALLLLIDSAIENDIERVISLGGGIASNQQLTSAIIRNLGLIVYLKIAPEAAWARIEAEGELPAYLEKEANPKQAFLQLAAERGKFYEQHANLIVELAPDAEPAQCVQKIQQLVKDRV